MQALAPRAGPLSGTLNIKALFSCVRTSGSKPGGPCQVSSRRGQAAFCRSEIAYILPSESRQQCQPNHVFSMYLIPVLSLLAHSSLLSGADSPHEPALY